MLALQARGWFLSHCLPSLIDIHVMAVVENLTFFLGSWHYLRWNNINFSARSHPFMEKNYTWSYLDLFFKFSNLKHKNLNWMIILMIVSSLQGYYLSLLHGNPCTALLQFVFVRLVWCRLKLALTRDILLS